MELPEKCCEKCQWLIKQEKKNRYNDTEFFCVISGGYMLDSYAKKDITKIKQTFPGGREWKCTFKAKNQNKGENKMASKFNFDKIKGSSAVGAGLLNEESLKMKKQKKTEYIPISKIFPNPRNEMSMAGIEELANQIKLSGLEQPLVVYQTEDGNYRILTGHRRYTAIKTLIEQGDWNENQPVECKVKDLDEMDVPLSTEDKEMLSLLVTNQTREKTDADIAFEIREWKQIILKLRASGVNVMVTGYDEEGNPIKENITGIRTQELVAKQLGMSNSQIAKFNKVENRGTDMLKAALKKGNINIANAANVAGMSEEDQESLIEKTLENKSDDEMITSDDIAKAKREMVHKTTVKKEDELPEGMINDKVFKKDIKLIQKAIKKSENGIQLTDNQYSEYCRHIEGLKKVFGC